MAIQSKAEEGISRLTRSKVVKLQLPKSYNLRSLGEEVEEGLPLGKPTNKIVTLSISPHLLAVIQKRNDPKAKTASAASSTINASVESSDVPRRNALANSSITVTEAGSPLRKSDGRSGVNSSLLGWPTRLSEDQGGVQQTQASLVYQRPPFSSMTSIPRQFESVQKHNNPLTSTIGHPPSRTYPASGPYLVEPLS